MSDPESFTTRTIEPSARAKTWSRYLAQVYFDMDVRTKDNELVDGDILKRNFGSIGFSRVAVSSTRVTRRRQSALVDKVERFCFVFPIRGSFDHLQRGIENRSEPGSVFFVNSAESYEVGHGDTENVCLTAPCDLVRARIRGIDDLCAKSGIADAMIVSALRHLVQETLVKGSHTDEARFEDLCIEMLELMLSKSKGAHAVASILLKPLARTRPS